MGFSLMMVDWSGVSRDCSISAGRLRLKLYMDRMFFILKIICEFFRSNSLLC